MYHIQLTYWWAPDRGNNAKQEQELHQYNNIMLLVIYQENYRRLI